LSVALALVALIALGTFGLVLILARRLKAVTERVNVFLPAVESTLPAPGTPLPEFDAVSADGEHVSRESFAGAGRILAIMSTGCGSCHEQITAFKELGVSLEPQPVVAIIGASEERASMAAQLDGHAVIIDDSHTEAIVAALEIREFPAVLLVRDGVIQQAGHELSKIAAGLAAKATPAGSAQRR
jgi:hypothetical protein